MLIIPYFGSQSRSRPLGSSSTTPSRAAENAHRQRRRWEKLLDPILHQPADATEKIHSDLDDKARKLRCSLCGRREDEKAVFVSSFSTEQKSKRRKKVTAFKVFGSIAERM